MTRYLYERCSRFAYKYWIVVETKAVGSVERDVWNSSRWLARIYTDPTTEGKGRTRDDAVDDAYEQVGGPD